MTVKRVGAPEHLSTPSRTRNGLRHDLGRADVEALVTGWGSPCGDDSDQSRDRRASPLPVRPSRRLFNQEIRPVAEWCHRHSGGCSGHTRSPRNAAYPSETVALAAVDMSPLERWPLRSNHVSG